MTFQNDAEKTLLPPTTLLNPVPVVMVSCAGKNPEEIPERPNIVTVAWAGTINSEPPMVSIALRKSRHSHGLITTTGEFVINLVGRSLLRSCDYCGVRSGRNEDKFAACRLTPVATQGLDFAPAIRESPLNLSCRVRSVQELGSHDLFLAEVVGAACRSSLIDADGKIRLDKAHLVAYSHGEYFQLGELLGFFGFSVASAQAYSRRMPQKKTAKKIQRMS
jgi:flavin reductase (DIM6/NTAB) family NADH-FMN oxidoreductase RutF